MNNIDKKAAKKCKPPKCHHLKPQPGLVKKFDKRTSTCENIDNLILKDYPGLRRTTLKQDCPRGYHMGAMAVDPKKEYHFYRRDNTGYWSHKNGSWPANDTDFDGKKIKDPKKANRKSKYTKYNFKKFCNYYCVPKKLKKRRKTRRKWNSLKKHTRRKKKRNISKGLSK